MRGGSTSFMVTHILIVEDFAPYRIFVTSMLHQRPDLRVMCEASDGLQAVAKAQELKPDLILLDIGLPQLNGIEAARRIRTAHPKCKIVFLSQESSPEVIHEALRLGPSGYVLKANAESNLLPAIDAVLQGKKFCPNGTGAQDPTGTDT